MNHLQIAHSKYSSIIPICKPRHTIVSTSQNRTTSSLKFPLLKTRMKSATNIVLFCALLVATVQLISGYSDGSDEIEIFKRGDDNNALDLELIYILRIFERLLAKKIMKMDDTAQARATQILELLGEDLSDENRRLLMSIKGENPKLYEQLYVESNNRRSTKM